MFLIISLLAEIEFLGNSISKNFLVLEIGAVFQLDLGFDWAILICVNALITFP